MARKIKNAVVKVGSYRDRATGQEKGSFKSVGSLMKNEDGTVFLILDRTFSPAGCPDPQGRGSVIVNLWDDQGAGSGASGGGASGSAASGGASHPPLDDEIPF